MSQDESRVAVVVPTRDRPRRLAALLEALRYQTLSASEFEVVVVDDGSTDPEVGTVLAQAETWSEPRVRVLRRESSLGPAAARNAGWRQTRAPLVAFTDDDCAPPPHWLEAALAAHGENPDAVIQGRTDPLPDEDHKRSPFARTLVIHDGGPPFETCNIFYPRPLLERLGGFDESFALPAGEDTDLGWRARGLGAPVVFAADAQTYHAVIVEGPVGMLRSALRWSQAVPVFAKHPQLRREHLHRGVFWSSRHEHLLRFLAALALLRRSRLVALVLAWPYLVHLTKRRSGPVLAPYILLHDLVEMYAVVRGGVRNRVLVI